MIKIETIKTGATVSSTTNFTVVKVNKKSVIVNDAKGNRKAINAVDFKKFNMEAESKPLNIKEKMPAWADSASKKQYVKLARNRGEKATKASWDGFNEFQKSLKKA